MDHILTRLIANCMFNIAGIFHFRISIACFVDYLWCIDKG